MLLATNPWEFGITDFNRVGASPWFVRGSGSCAEWNYTEGELCWRERASMAREQNGAAAPGAAEGAQPGEKGAQRGPPGSAQLPDKSGKLEEVGSAPWDQGHRGNGLRLGQGSFRVDIGRNWTAPVLGADGKLQRS